jgi:hypothetical protein
MRLAVSTANTTCGGQDFKNPGALSRVDHHVFVSQVTKTEVLGFAFHETLVSATMTSKDN